ncbi:serine/threonine protein phosphatase PP2A-associated protein [Rhodocollybia butyracea]|uniref:Serine/threonine protein phosphatase PP2A-associated protein n=1 Tax=Rhodocollybia butyracea TaxID=206335 RepID=A0A9P5PZ95_9AGAR|nr:serine/threonine protein phosphatase PP2A-associated protein [Rhodocollybia butyracea]
MTLPLPVLFARSLSAASKASNLPTIADQTQDLTQSSLTDLRTIQSRITGLSLFSPNETLEDVSTRDLVYLLIPYVCAQVQDRVKTLERDERLESLTFCKHLDTYGIIPEDEVALYERKSANQASRRELKIKQYQKEKDLRARIETIRKRRNQRPVVNSDTPNDFDLISSLLPSADITVTDEDEDDSSTDEILRETTLLLIRLCYAQAQSQFQNIDQELQLLRSAPPVVSHSPGAEESDRRGKKKEQEDHMWKLDAPVPNADGKALLDSAGKPLRPFTILPAGTTDRARFQAQVFGPGHNLPTMSVDEYLEIERQRGKFISGGGPASENAPTSSEQLALESEMDGTADAEEKSEIKRIKDESWARFTDENPRGAGNTMNRG